MAVALTGDPDYMTHSLDDSFGSAGARDASELIIYKRLFDINAINQEGWGFDPYQIGAFISSLFYGIEQNIDGIANGSANIPAFTTRRTVAVAVYKSIKELGETNLKYFDIWDFLNIYLKNSMPEHVDNICEELNLRYAIHMNNIKGCQ
jgi:hypothetical protein